jgi:hypothetical protein
MPVLMVGLLHHLALKSWESAVSKADVIDAARRVAFLGAHISDRPDGLAMLERHLARLYNVITAHDRDEPDLTFCLGCLEEIDPSEGQYVMGGGKYHGPQCLPKAA